jgi:hypothetical protein
MSLLEQILICLFVVSGMDFDSRRKPNFTGKIVAAALTFIVVNSYSCLHSFPYHVILIGVTTSTIAL